MIYGLHYVPVNEFVVLKFSEGATGRPLTHLRGLTLIYAPLGNRFNIFNIVVWLHR